MKDYERGALYQNVIDEYKRRLIELDREFIHRLRTEVELNKAEAFNTLAIAKAEVEDARNVQFNQIIPQ